MPAQPANAWKTATSPETNLGTTKMTDWPVKLQGILSCHNFEKEPDVLQITERAVALAEW